MRIAVCGAAVLAILAAESAGPEADDYLLLKFVPSQIEVMSFTHGVGADPTAFRPAILERSGSGWVVRGGT